MRILIDFQGGQTDSRYRGIGRYSLALAKAIIRNKSEHEVFIVLNNFYSNTIEPIRTEFQSLLPRDNIKVWSAPEQGYRADCEVSEVLREGFIASLEPDIIHIMSMFEYSAGFVTSINRFSNAPVSVLVYDLIPLLNPDEYLKPNPEFEKSYLKKVKYLRRASLLLGISESTCLEAVEALADDNLVVHNISTAADSIFQKIDISEQELLAFNEKFNINKKIVLYTGGADERKNLSRLISAYALLSSTRRKDYQLVFAGKFPSHTMEQLKGLAKSKGISANELIFTGDISDDGLVFFYNICTLYVFPSWHEGFGLPALEAMSCGAAVIGANATSLPEVIGNINALFDPFSERDIANKIEEVLSDENFRLELIEYGKHQAKLFSWDRTATTAIGLMESVIKSESREKQQVTVHEVISAVKEQLSSKNISESDLALSAKHIAFNHPAPRDKHIFIDVSDLVDTKLQSGVQRVTKSIVESLLGKDSSGCVIKPVYTNKGGSGYFYADLSNGQTINHPELIQVENGDVFLGLDLNHENVVKEREYLEGIRKQGVSVFYVIYDLLPVQLRHAFSPLATKNHAIWLDLITSFDGGICISETVRNVLLGWIENNYPEKKNSFMITSFRLGSDLSATSDVCGISEQHNELCHEISKRPNFLMVGTLEPRKGYSQTLNAFEVLWERGVDINLTIVGRSGWMVDELIRRINDHDEKDKRLFWVNDASDSMLNEIYATSTALLAASDDEGFGLPLVEASRRKLPIIAHDIEIFREVAGNGAYYFECKTPEFFAQEIQHWLSLFNEGKHPYSDEIECITWDESANRLLENVIRMQSTIK